MTKRSLYNKVTYRIVKFLRPDMIADLTTLRVTEAVNDKLTSENRRYKDRLLCPDVFIEVRREDPRHVEVVGTMYLCDGVKVVYNLAVRPEIVEDEGHLKYLKDKIAKTIGVVYIQRGLDKTIGDNDNGIRTTDTQ